MALGAIVLLIALVVAGAADASPMTQGKAEAIRIALPVMAK